MNSNRGMVSDRMTEWNDEIDMVESSNNQCQMDHKLPVAVEEGLDFLLSHFRKPVFPRTISSKATGKTQVVKYSREEVLAEFRRADYLQDIGLPILETFYGLRICRD